VFQISFTNVKDIIRFGSKLYFYQQVIINNNLQNNIDKD